MTWQRVEEKFFSETAAFTSRKNATKIATRVAQLESAADIHGFMKLLTRAARPGGKYNHAANRQRPLKTG
jgi:hypothetical protein